MKSLVALLMYGYCFFGQPGHDVNESTQGILSVSYIESRLSPVPMDPAILMWLEGASCALFSQGTLEVFTAISWNLNFWSSHPYWVAEICLELLSLDTAVLGSCSESPGFQTYSSLPHCIAESLFHLEKLGSLIPATEETSALAYCFNGTRSS